MTNSAPSIAFIGFGEAGQAIGGGLAGEGAKVGAYDLKFDGPEREVRLSGAADLGVAAAASAADAAASAEIVISTVTAGSAREVAEAAAAYIRPGQIFADFNSVSPDDKKAGAAAVEAAGGTYVEAAIMAPVHPRGHKTPILLAGPAAETLRARLAPLGMDVQVAGEAFGAASAIKMSRSIFIKGLEAITVECLMTARGYGVEDRVHASLAASYPGLDWETHRAYLLDRVLVHGKRRAEEMRCAAETVASLGLDPRMATATADLQQWVADLVAAGQVDVAGTDPADAEKRVDMMLGAAGGAADTAPQRSGTGE